MIFLTSVIFLLKLFDDIAKKERYSYYLSCFFLIALFIANGFLWANLELTSSECRLVLLLSAFMFFSFRGQKTQKNSCYISAFLVACYATYCKEPIFGVFTVIALTNLIFGHLTKKDKIFNVGLLINALLYLIAYYFISYRKAVCLYGFYGVMPPDGLLAQMARVLGELSDLVNMLYPILLLSLIRAYFLVFKKDREHLFADGIIFASAAYACAIIFVLVRSYSYYFTPCFVLATPAFFYWAAIYVKKTKFLTILSLTVFSFLMIGDFKCTKATFRSYMWQRKNDMPLIKIISDEIAKGKKVIYWCSSSLMQDSKYWPGLKNTIDWYCFSFINYLMGKVNSIRVESGDISLAGNNNLLMYPLRNYEYAKSDEDVTWLENNNFSTVARVVGVNLLRVKRIRPLKLPFFL
ncbi:MAG: hypothetical protein LBS23_00065 [Holosporaceae bacterium]|nr:hypothetical protein [Holosporaceae bacterium]